jgi:hypothetical protein
LKEPHDLPRDFQQIPINLATKITGRLPNQNDSRAAGGLRLFEIARVLVRLNHIARCIVNRELKHHLHKGWTDAADKDSFDQPILPIGIRNHPTVA